MKKTLLIICSVVIYSSIFAQIPNSGFETWKNKLIYEDPDLWGTINSLTSLVGVKTATKISGSDAHSGSYALQLETKDVSGQKATGICATGTINSSTKLVDGGFAYTMRPDSMTGWYKYAPVGGDSATVSIALWKWNSSTNKRDTIGEGRLADASTISSYKKFAFKINYTSSSSPDSAVIIIKSSSTSPQLGSKLIIDDLGFAFGAVTSSISQTNPNVNISVFPNPASDEINVAINGTIDNEKSTIILTDMQGRIVFEKNTINRYFSKDVSGLDRGVYFLSVVNNESVIHHTRVIVR